MIFEKKKNPKPHVSVSLIFSVPLGDFFKKQGKQRKKRIKKEKEKTKNKDKKKKTKGLPPETAQKFDFR